MDSRDIVLAQVESLVSQARGVDVVFRMDEDAFRAFYDRTARPLWAYVSRMAGDPQFADDLLQESYFRFLRAGVAWESEAHCRRYLFRIATNLVNDHRWRRRRREVPLPEPGTAWEPRADTDVAGGAERRTDVGRALARLRPRERQLLWLAYAEGASHREIAAALGLALGGIRVMLFRARRRMAALLAESRSGGS